MNTDEQAEPRVISYVEAAEELLLWGKRTTKSYTEALKDGTFSKEEKILGALLAIIKRWDKVIDALVEPIIMERTRKVSELHRRGAMGEIEDREDKHGPCPKELRVYLYRQALNCAARQQMSHGDNMKESVWVDVDPPEKDHPLRKVYDRWMRRKAKNSP